MTTTLVDELTLADNKFGRPAVPSVYAEYVAFVESGRYPYIDSVVVAITATHQVPGEGTHHPFGGLRKKLAHEVYLASGQYRLAQKVEEERRRGLAGWLPITDLEPVQGQRIKLEPDGPTYRLRQAQNDWVLLPPKARTTGLSLNALQGQHRAFLEARDRGQVSMNNPRVRMWVSA